MTICNKPEIAKEIRALLTKETAGQRGKNKALGMVIRFIFPVFPGFSISEIIFLQLMARVKWMNQGDIDDQVSRRRKSVGGTGDIEASHAGNNVTAARLRGIVICTRNSAGSSGEGQPSLVGQPSETVSQSLKG
jgi:hypothetical protein